MKRIGSSIGALVTACTFGLAAHGDAGVKVFTVKMSNAVGETQTLQALPKQLGIYDFELKYNQGDHTIHSIGFLPKTDRVELAMTDVNGGDPFGFSGNFTSVSGSGGLYAKKDCGNANPCTIDLAPPVAGGSLFVLMGFKFWRNDGKEANVRRMMVRGSAEASNVKVAFADDGNAAYHAAVQYAYAARNEFKSIATSTATRSGNVAYAFCKTPVAGRAIVTGFDVQFDNGDHHLGQLAIKRPGNAGFNVYFNDQNTDDPFHATIDYAVYQQ